MTMNRYKARIMSVKNGVTFGIPSNAIDLKTKQCVDDAVLIVSWLEKL